MYMYNSLCVQSNMLENITIHSGRDDIGVLNPATLGVFVVGFATMMGTYDMESLSPF